MIKIYHVAGTRGLRAIWTCEELSIPYEVEVVNFDPEYRASPEWRSINPAGKVPAMSDGDLMRLRHELEQSMSCGMNELEFEQRELVW